MKLKLKNWFMAALFIPFVGTFNVYALDSTSIAKDYDSLPDTVKAEIAKSVMREKERYATKATEAAKESVPAVVEKAKEVVAAAPEKAFDYAAKGAEIGRALASAAKELGVAADNFLNSTTGKLTAFVIVYKLIGAEVVKIAVGFGLFATLVPLWFYIWRRKFYKVTVDSEPVPLKLLWFIPLVYTKKTVVSERRDDADGFEEFLQFVLLGGIVVLSLCVAF